MEKINGNDILCEFDLEEAKNSEGKEIEISACVHKVKKMGGFAFVILRTARYLIQSVYSPETCPDSIDGIKEGCFVTVKGTVRRDDRAYNGIEIAMTGIKLIHKPEFDYPLHVSARKIGCTLDVNLDNRSVALRNPVERAVFKFQEGVVSGFREFMIKNKFTEIHTPKIVAQAQRAAQTSSVSTTSITRHSSTSLLSSTSRLLWLSSTEFSRSLPFTVQSVTQPHVT